MTAKTERMKAHIAWMNEAEIIRQQFLVKGRAIADQARDIYLNKGMKAVRKFASTLKEKSGV